MDWESIPEIQEGVDLIVTQLEYAYRMGRDAAVDEQMPRADLRSLAFFIAGIGMGTAMRVMAKPNATT